MYDYAHHCVCLMYAYVCVLFLRAYIFFWLCIPVRRCVLVQVSMCNQEIQQTHVRLFCTTMQGEIDRKIEFYDKQQPVM